MRFSLWCHGENTAKSILRRTKLKFSDKNNESANEASLIYGLIHGRFSHWEIKSVGIWRRAIKEK